ncbi:MAG TPA: M56 family metallopeptidase, partial [Vicinamibacteria bacterium]
IALHELLHARRGDWLPLLIEELLKALFFFHPAVHWLVRRVRLAREQAVDAAVVERLGGRESYVESLVEVAKLAARARAVPAAPFLRESHLRERVDLLLKEVAMSPVRVLAHISLTAGTLVLATGWAVAAAPLQSATAVAPALPAPSHSGSLPMEAKAATTEPKLLHKLNPVYPPDAKADKVEGVFVIGVVVGKDGAIREARVATSAPTLERLGELQSRAGGTSTSSQEGDARLAAAALDAVRQWRYEPTIKDGQAVDVKMTLTICFRLD